MNNNTFTLSSSRPGWLTRLAMRAFAAVITAGALHTAGAATRQVVPKIELFEVDPTEDIAPGTELSLRVEGTAKGTASVRIQGIAKTLTLPEIDEGVYETTYTLRSKDKVVNGASVKATLKVGTRSATDTLEGGLSVAKAAAVVVPAAATGAAITRFGVGPVTKIEPGIDLVFTLDGTAGGSGGVKVVGIASELPLREVSAGHYEASYTVRRADKIAADAKATARLTANGKTATATLAQALALGGANDEVAATASTVLPLKITSHQDNALVPTGPVTIRGNTAANADIDVEVIARANVGGFFGVNQSLLKQRVTADAKGDFSFVFRPPVAVRGASYDISLSGYKGAQKAGLKLTLTQEK